MQGRREEENDEGSRKGESGNKVLRRKTRKKDELRTMKYNDAK